MKRTGLLVGNDFEKIPKEAARSCFVSVGVASKRYH